MQYRKSYWSLASCATVLGLSVSSSRGAVTADTFTLATHSGTGPGGIAVSGDPLNGTSAEVGGGTWTTAGDFQLRTEGSNGLVEYTAATDPANAVVPITYTPGQIITASADIRPMSSGGDNWVALGLTNQNLVVSFTATSTGGQPWMLLRDTGNFSGFSGPGIQDNEGSTNLSNFDPTVFHHVSITLDPTTHNNGTTTFGQVTMTVDTTSTSFDMDVNPSITGAGFTFHGGAGVNAATPTALDNFQVTSTPEPAASILLGLAAIASRGLRRR